MKTDYTCLNFILADLQLHRELGGFHSPARLEEAVITILEYLIEKDKPIRELILMKKTAQVKKKLKPMSKEHMKEYSGFSAKKLASHMKEEKQLLKIKKAKKSVAKPSAKKKISSRY